MSEIDLPGFTQTGFLILSQFISPSVADNLIEKIDGTTGTDIIRRRQVTYGIRNLPRVVPEIRVLAESTRMRALTASILGNQARLVRGIFFDKTPQTNWGVAWHQDLAIPVQKKMEVAGFGPWSVKAGVWHALAPASVLERMLTIRIHLDNAGEQNGALHVLRGSHLQGKLSDEEVEQWQNQQRPVICSVKKGDALLMRPLLLHTSYSSASPDHRRVIHLEFAVDDLPGELKWHVP
jgi:ectoine hydroxylase-related dioxygenase (phytanoyl-CoA dioxygenase family)